jgi:cyclophilin family peptidyl-prolyl cis-trans isomerase
VALAEDRREAGSTALIGALEQGDRRSRARAAVAMARIQSPSYAGSLIEAAGGGPSEVRETALWALGQLGLAEGARIPPEVTRACLAALADPEPGIVAAALQALGKQAAPGVAADITPFLWHESPTVRVEAAMALFRLRFVPLWRSEAETPAELPPDAVDALIQRFGDPVDEVRRAAAYAFSRYGQPEAVPDLAALVRDRDEWTRLFAIRAIARSGDSDGAEAVRQAMSDASPRVRAEAVQAMSALQVPDLVDPALAGDPSFHVRAALARALGDSRGAATLETLRRLETEDESFTVRGAAIEALARRLGEGYLEDLKRALRDESWPLRVAATRAAGAIGPAGLELARAAWSDDDGRVRTAAIEILGSRDGPATQIVAAALESADLAERGTALSVLADGELPDKLGKLQRVYEQSSGTEWIEIREAVVEALIEVEEAGDLLQAIAADDPAPSVRNRARRLLARRGASAPPPAPLAVNPSPLLGTRYSEDPLVLLETSRGPIEIRCHAGDAPIHVANFVKLVREGFYDGLIWHRVVSNFVIQGGDPRGDGWGSAGYTLRDEIHRRPFGRGTVGMPKAGKDTGSCQIFITHLPTPHLDGNYTVFGEVSSGIEVVDRIEVGDEIRRAYVLE